MGREIRRVPPNWEHPRNDVGEYIPMHDKDIEAAGREWLDECIAWDNGTHEVLVKHPERKSEYPFFWIYEGAPPDSETCRPKFEVEPTWYQVYQTVSEGTPVTPPFATKEELIDYLVTHGDFWDQRRGDGGWLRENAESFVGREWAPSMIVVRTPECTMIKSPRDGA